MDLTQLAPKKFILNSSAAVTTFGMTFLLLRFRYIPILHKVLLCLLISMLASPVYLSVELLMDAIQKYPDPLEIDFNAAGNTLTYGSSAFFGWLCLFVALLYNFEVRDRERSLAVVREEALTAQMRALRYQVNPHFLFNTLNSIAGLIEEGSATRAERMVLSLSTFLRATLSLDPMHDVPLADELALQEEYLEIERERFSDRMEFTIDMPEEVRSALVPSLILQPLIENAIKHGVGATVGKVEIALRARREADRLRVTVENDMPVRDEGVKPAGMGVGLRNVAERLRARFQEEGSFSSGPAAPGRYRASIDLPWRLA
ncbi:histidine kinase [Bradyrhizobium iriomotense]|nr:histidine kinase [Bradyrhizobium iriomotense]